MVCRAVTGSNRDENVLIKFRPHRPHLPPSPNRHLTWSVAQYEPVFDSPASRPFMQHIILYECQAASPELELMSREPGRRCSRPNAPPLSCNAIVATWARGSEVSSGCWGVGAGGVNSKIYMWGVWYAIEGCAVD